MVKNIAMKKRIPIFFAVDDNYIKYLYLTLLSIKDKASGDYKYDITILHNGLSLESQSLIRKLKDHHFHFRFDNIGLEVQALSSKLKVRDYYTLTTYYRLVIPNKYPFLDKALYLDCDIIVRDDIAKLYNEDIGDNLLGAIPDSSVLLYKEFQTYVNEALRIKTENYFNAGVLIMNLKKMRQVRFQKQVVNLSSKIAFRVAQDQDLLNVLCKDKVQYISLDWNTMPLGERKNNPHLVHYNLTYKPWKFENIMYNEYFWHYAEIAGFKDQIEEARSKIPPEIRKMEEEGLANLKKMCLKEAKKASKYDAALQYNEAQIEEEERLLHNEARAEILKKIELYEKEGRFDQDVEDDPPYTPLHIGDVDYEHRRLSTKIKAKVYLDFAFRYFNKLIKKKQIIIDDYVGVENLKALEGGAVLTQNHFSPFDSIPIHKLTRKVFPRKHLFKIIREGNYTFPGLYGRFMRYCYTLPLAQDIDVMREMMKATDKWLKKGHLLLVYAEQSMWWNYKKPKPLKPGAFRFAAKSNVPVIPTFITMRDLDEKDPDGYPLQAYTLHIGKPIYPDPNLSVKENAEMMRKENEKVWKNMYETAYGVPLTYTTEKEEE